MPARRAFIGGDAAFAAGCRGWPSTVPVHVRQARGESNITSKMTDPKGEPGRFNTTLLRAADARLGGIARGEIEPAGAT